MYKHGWELNMRNMLLLVFSLALVGCQATAGDGGGTVIPPGQPAPPGSTNTSFRANPERWILTRREEGASRKSTYLCRPLACEKPTTIVYSNRNSPTRNPDAGALKERAEQTRKILESRGYKDITVKNGNVLGYPATMIEFSTTRDGKKTYVADVEIFAGAALIGMMSASSDRRVAIKHREEMTLSIEINDGGSR